MGHTSAWQWLSVWWQAAIDLILPQPPECALCGAATAAPPLCPGCLGSVGFPPDLPTCASCCRPLRGATAGAGRCTECTTGEFSLDGVVALGPFSDKLQEAIHALKFHGRSDLARPLGQALGRRIQSEPPPTALVPVPLHRLRQAARGYNQALLLAQAVAPLAGAPVQSWLQRRQNTPAQSGLGRTARFVNLRDAFVATAPAGRLRGARIILVDDVLTTGATAMAAAAALRAAGAASVELAVLAVSTTPVLAADG